MNKRKEGLKSSSSASKAISCKYKLRGTPRIEHLSESEVLETCSSMYHNTNSTRMLNPEHALTTIIDTKVSSLRAKIGELGGLRKKMIESAANLDSKPLSYVLKPRIKTFEPSKLQKHMHVSGSICQSDDKRTKASENIEKDSDADTRFNYNPSFDRLLFENEASRNYPETKTSRFDNESLKIKLRTLEKELRDSETTNLYLESIITQKDQEISGLEDKYKKLSEVNKSLRLQINRLEGQLKTDDNKKDTKANAIKNLSYIILSKENLKDNPSRYDQSSSVSVKYVEILNELHNCDKFVISVFEKMKAKQHNDAFRMMLQAQETTRERLEKTRQCLNELEEVVNECKSPVMKKNKKHSCEKDELKQLDCSDYFSFMKCQATLIEELFMVA